MSDRKAQTLTWSGNKPANCRWHHSEARRCRALNLCRGTGSNRPALPLPSLNAVTPRFPRAKRLLVSLCALSLLVPAAPPAAWAQDRLPALGESVSEDLSVGNERRIGELGRRETLPFNGYADEVASLYAGMDLRKEF